MSWVRLPNSLPMPIPDRWSDLLSTPVARRQSKPVCRDEPCSACRMCTQTFQYLAVASDAALEYAQQFCGTAGSVGDHLLGSYLQALLAILLAQFSAKGFPGGMDGVVRLAEKSTPIKVAIILLSLALSCLLSHVSQQQSQHCPPSGHEIRSVQM